jgi:N-acetylmuramoyl-L-alanine amidase
VKPIITLATILSTLMPIRALAEPQATALPFPTRLPAATVVIDPGHGGDDWGATGEQQESKIVLAIGLQVAKILEAHGVKVKLTRDGDYFISLARRVEISQESKANIFISIHANEYSNPGAMGVETYGDVSLAQPIQDAIVSRLAAVDRGIKSARFYVLRKSSVPAVLVEVGFVSNKLEGALLGTVEYQNRMADSIARGILKYLGIEYKLVPAKV